MFSRFSAIFSVSSLYKSSYGRFSGDFSEMTLENNGMSVRPSICQHFCVFLSPPVLRGRLRNFADWYWTLVRIFAQSSILRFLPRGRCGGASLKVFKSIHSLQFSFVWAETWYDNTRHQSVLSFEAEFLYFLPVSGRTSCNLQIDSQATVLITLTWNLVGWY